MNLAFYLPFTVSLSMRFTAVNAAPKNTLTNKVKHEYQNPIRILKLNTYFKNEYLKIFGSNPIKHFVN